MRSTSVWYTMYKTIFWSEHFKQWSVESYRPKRLVREKNDVCWMLKYFWPDAGQPSSGGHLFEPRTQLVI